MLEALLLVVSAQAAAATAGKTATLPSSELLEFLGEWPDDGDGADAVPDPAARPTHSQPKRRTDDVPAAEKTGHDATPHP